MNGLIDALGLAALTLLLTLPMLVYIVVLVRKRLFFARGGGVKTAGSVVKQEVNMYGRAFSLVEFVDARGAVNRFRTRGQIAGRVNVVYDPDRPRRAEAVINVEPTMEEFVQIGCGAIFFGLALMSGLVFALVVAFR